MTNTSDITDDLPSGDAKRVNQAIASASRVLGMREYSVKMIRDKLAQKAYSSDEAQQAIAFLLENNWLSDERFCESFIRSKVARGLGYARICYELTQKGVAKTQIEATLCNTPVDWQETCDSTAKKKLASGAIPSNLKGRLKLERFLRSRGFSGSEINQSINQYFVMGVKTSEYDE